MSTKAVHIDFTGGTEIYEEIEEILNELQGGVGILGKIICFLLQSL